MTAEPALSIAETPEPSGYAAWLDRATEFDRSTGRLDWRRQDEGPYDHQDVRARLRRLMELRKTGDSQGLLFVLNEGIHGNISGIGRTKLYTHARSGTKHLIDDYVRTVSDSLWYIQNCDGVADAEKDDFFERASNCYGRTALMLSGGAAMGFFHYGVVKALFEQNLLPDVISGSSAGSLVSAVVGTRSDADLHQIFDAENLTAGKRPSLPVLPLIRREETGNRTRMLAEHIDTLIPNLTFQEAFDRTGRRINISIAPASNLQSSRLLNAITSPNVFIRSAVMASCAIPGIFESVQLYAKNDRGEEQPYLPDQRWIDGSVASDLPAKRLSRLYGVNHSIASQVNPHIIPFVQEFRNNPLVSNVNTVTSLFAKQWIRGAQGVARRFGGFAGLGYLLDIAHSVVDQDYTADINVVPKLSYLNPLWLLEVPGREDIAKLIREGEEATWPFIARLRNAMQVSQTLDAIRAIRGI